MFLELLHKVRVCWSKPRPNLSKDGSGGSSSLILKQSPEVRMKSCDIDFRADVQHVGRIIRLVFLISESFEVALIDSTADPFPDAGLGVSQAA